MKSLERVSVCDVCGTERMEQIAATTGTPRSRRYVYPSTAGGAACKTRGHDWRVSGFNALPGPPLSGQQAAEELEFEQYREDLIAFEEYRAELLKRYPPK